MKYYLVMVFILLKILNLMDFKEAQFLTVASNPLDKSSRTNSNKSATTHTGRRFISNSHSDNQKFKKKIHQSTVKKFEQHSNIWGTDTPLFNIFSKRGLAVSLKKKKVVPLVTDALENKKDGF